MDSKRKILLVNDFERGGGAESVFLLTAKLLEGQYEVHKYTAYKGFQDTGSNPIEYIYSRKHYNNIRKIILEKDIDIVHVHNFRWISPSVFHVSRWLKKHRKEKRVKFVLTAHDYFLACPNVAYGYYENKKFIRYRSDKKPGTFIFKQMDQHGWKFSALKKLQWYLAFPVLGLEREVDMIISPSYFLRNVLEVNYGNLPIEVVRNPINMEGSSDEQIVNTKSELLRIVYFGRVASEKGTDLLLRMLSENKNRVAFRLDIFGTGPLNDDIVPMIERLGLNEIVFYHGFQPFDKIQARLLDFDAFIMSSIWYENAPLSIVEAAMNNLQLIVPNMGGMKELAELCGDAFFYELNNGQSLLQALQDAINTVDKRDRADNKEVLRSLFSEQLYVKKIKESYESLTYR